MITNNLVPEQEERLNRIAIYPSSVVMVLECINTICIRKLLVLFVRKEMHKQ